jgi:hypothetical protein
MLATLLVVLVVLWFFGFLNLSFLNYYVIGDLTLLNLIIIGLLLYFVFSVAPSFLRVIIGIALILYLLSVLGIISIAGLGNMLILAAIIAVALYVLGIVR